MIHKPVLLEEVIENLNLKPGMTVVDGTLGAGGHSTAILEKILPGGKLISIDLDKKAIENFEKKLQEGIFVAKRELIFTRAHEDAIGLARSAPVNNNKNDNRTSSQFIELGNRGGKIVGYWRGAADNYANIKEIARGLGINSADAVLADLGFSSDQIEDPARGFSFLRNGPLDMRYSPETQKKTAADIVNGYSEEKLAEIFRNYGEEKFARRIAKGIVKTREIRLHQGFSGQVRETGELVDIISKSIPEKYQRGKIHFATRIFQALRIETNREFENLKKFLEGAVDILAGEGRLAIIDFHSLEDRIVKNFFKEESRDCVCPPKFPKCVCDHRVRLKIVTKKPIVASEDEVRENPGARSAKLRVAEKI